MQEFKATIRHIPAHQWLLYIVGILFCFGFVMVTSSSIPFAESEARIENPYHFVIRQFIYGMAGIIAAFVVSRFKSDFWFSHRKPVLIWLLGWLFLAITLFFPKVNGSTRWIMLGPINIQTTEFVKIIMALYIAEYVVVFKDQVKTTKMGLGRLVAGLSIIIPIMLQPDLGASIVIVMTVMAVFFLAGAPVPQFAVLFASAMLFIGVFITITEYRYERIISFMDPWDNRFEGSYQLVNSLLAIGRGEITGVGLGNSLLKLAHLPEAHTDFILAIIGEELGFIGVLFVIIMQGLFVATATYIGTSAIKNGREKQGYFTYGLVVILVVQIYINIGMNLGIMPTKGITLPLISYGGSSLMSVFIMVGLMYRIHADTIAHKFNATRHVKVDD